MFLLAARDVIITQHADGEHYQYYIISIIEKLLCFLVVLVF